MDGSVYVPSQLKPFTLRVRGSTLRGVLDTKVAAKIGMTLMIFAKCMLGEKYNRIRRQAQISWRK